MDALPVEEATDLPYASNATSGWRACSWKRIARASPVPLNAIFGNVLEHTPAAPDRHGIGRIHEQPGIKAGLIAMSDPVSFTGGPHF